MNNTTKHSAGIFFYTPILLLFLIFVSCNQGPQTEPLPEAPNERLAYAVAAALGNPEVRESVHAAMDASPYVEHKLVLQEFLETPEGSDLQGALSHELGGQKMLTDLLAGFPDLDFYLPYETHRETWEHANHNLWAVCVLDPDAKEGTAYHPDGSSRVLSSRQQIRQAEIAALFSLHRAEAKILRNPATTTRIPNVQTDKDDWKTGIDKILNYTTDGGVFSGNCEFYFQSDDGNYTSDVVSVDGLVIDLTDPWAPKMERGEKDISPPLPVNPESASESHHIKVVMMEDDGFLNGGDDYYGTFDVTGEDTYETQKTIFHDAVGATDPWAVVSFVVD